MKAIAVVNITTRSAPATPISAATTLVLIEESRGVHTIPIRSVGLRCRSRDRVKRWWAGMGRWPHR
jgi:hypothetical protein